MGVDIAWFVNQHEIEGVSWIAGRTGSCNEIRAVNIMDNPDTACWLKGGELVLTTGYFADADPGWQGDIITQLHQMGCAGLGIKMKRYLNEVPEVMMRQAEELGFPILELPYERPFSEINQLIYKEIFRQEKQKADEKADIYRRLTEVLMREHTMEQLLMVLEEHISNPMLLTGAGFGLLAYECPEKVRSEFEQLFSFRENFSIFPSRDTEQLLAEYEERKFVVKSVPVGQPGMGWNCLIFSITDNKMLLGFLCVPEMCFSLSKEDLSTIDEVKSVISLELLRHNLRGLGRKNVKNNFLNVLMGQVQTPSEIEAQCDLYGFPYSRKRVCAVLRLEKFVSLPSYVRKDMEEKISRTLYKVTEQERVTFFQLSYNNHIVVYFLFTERMQNREYIQEALRMSGEICRILTDQGIALEIGISECHSGVETIREEFQQGIRALKLGCYLHSDTKVYSYWQDAVYHLLTEGVSRKKQQQLYQETIQVLDEYDEENHTELADTLQGYFEWNKNSKMASQKLYIHRNTLAGRLEKIRELLGSDLTSEQECLMLQLGLYARRLLQIKDPNL